MEANDCVKDVTEETNAQKKGLKYLRKILQTHNLNVDTIDANTFFNFLETYEVRNCSSGKDHTLAYGSIKYLICIMCKHRPSIRMGDVVTFKKRRKQLWQERRATDYFHPTLKQEDAIIDCIHQAIELFLENTSGLDYTVGLAVALTIATNLRSSELQQLSYNNLEQMLAGQTIPIRIKKKSRPLHILVNREMMKGILRRLMSTQHNNNERILKYSSVSINRRFRAMVIQHEPSTKHLPLGIQAIRKINTTILIEHGSIDLARVFNRHNSRQTTAQYYNTQNYITKHINRSFQTMLHQSEE